MLFNSFEFLVFLPIVFVLYWFGFSKSKVSQNVFLLLSSYVFYSFWDWRFSFLLAFSTILDYSSGIIIDQSTTINKKRFWMRLSILTNIGLLCYFKYFNFFIDSFIDLINHFGFHADTYTLNIILPIGISFYTFHGVSYVLDIYYGRMRAHRDVLDYSLFVSYFPLLVAGPIERATHLLPQLKVKRRFKYIQGVEGCKLILWGMFKKVVIADSLAPIVDQIFTEYHSLDSISLIVGAISFTVQVYADFSGYTDIARGVSKLLGIELILNFNYPFFSKTIPEFWNRWHISLSSWLNDYVFTPLALNFRNFGKPGIFLAVFLTFTISGFWHGTGWNYVVWGMINGLYYIPFVFSKKGLKGLIRKENRNQILLKDVPMIILTFSLYAFSMIFFRASSFSEAIRYVISIYSVDFFNSELIHKALKPIFFWSLLLILDYKMLEKENNLKSFRNSQWLYVLLAILTMWLFLAFDTSQNFVYFKF
jgi:D-alanyl-lipoteichoic acid acyltransferase DltB (MBOAT superfamily)